MAEIRKAKFGLLITLVGLSVVLIVVGFLWPLPSGFDGVEKVSYITQLSFNPESLEDITETAEGDAVRAGLGSPEARATIPANSKVHLAFETACIDKGNYGVPDENVPVVFSYERLDMPLFEEIAAYVFAHPELDPVITQGLFWDLSSEYGVLWGLPFEGPLEFDALFEPLQATLLEIDPNAREVVESYEYYRDITVKNFSFEEGLPEEVVAQPIPGTELYAKIVKTDDYYYTELEVYNPSSRPQVLSLFKKDVGILTFVPNPWARKVRVWKEGESLTFGVVWGKFDIRENIFRTPADSGAVIELEGGIQRTIEPNSELSFDQLKQMVEEGAVSWWGRLLYRLFGPFPAGAMWGRNKYQMKVPTTITGVRG